MTSTSRHSDYGRITLPRRVRHYSDGTFGIEGDAFVTTDVTLARAVARELDRIDPSYW